MRAEFVLGGLSVAFAQTLTLLSSVRPSLQSSLSASLSLSSRNTPSSAIVAPTSSVSKPLASSTSISQAALSSGSSPGSVNNTTSTIPAPTTYENPWVGNFSGTISLHGTGSAYALQCQNAWFSYTSINSDYISATFSRYYVTSTIRNVTVYEVHTSYETAYYTLCDGHPRVITSTPTATVTTTWPPSTTTILVQGISQAKYPDPNCTVSWDDCQGLWSRYYSASSVYNSISFSLANTVVQLGSGASYWIVNGVTTTFPAPSPMSISLGTESIHKYYQSGKYLVVTTPPPGGFFCDCGYTMTAGGPPVTIQHTIDFTNTPYTPSCRTEKPTCTANQRCRIDGDRVEIYWFPPQTNVTRDMCATVPANGPITSRPPTNYTWTPITTGPYTVLPGNTTWFSGNVYVSLNRINARCDWSGTSVEVGSTHQGEILTIAPSELFSQRAFLTNIGERSSMVDFEPYAYSFNFDDLVSPYPWSAWNGAFDCVKTKCSTMSGSYNPWIAVPEAIRRLDPQWATCDLALYGLYDPPIALNTIGNMFATTTRPPQSGPQPTPGQSPQQSQVEPTNTPLVPGAPLPWQSEPSTLLPPVVGPPGIPGPSPRPDDGPAPQDPSRPNPIPQNPNDPSNPSPLGNPGSNPRPGLTPAPVFPQPTTIGTVGSTPVVVNPSNPSQINVGTVILTPGSPGITVGTSTIISMLDPSHVIVSVPGAPAPSTINIPQPIGNGAPTPTAGVVIALPNDEHVTATAIIGEGHSGSQAATSIVVSGTMFSEGGPPITLANGVILSEAPSGTGIVVIYPFSGVTSTIPFSSVPGIYNPYLTPSPTALITVGDRTYTAITQSGSVIIPELSLTLTNGGPAATVEGTTVSNAGEGTGLVVGTLTAEFTKPTGSGGASGAVPTGASARTLGCQWCKHWWVRLAFIGTMIAITT